MIPGGVPRISRGVTRPKLPSVQGRTNARLSGGHKRIATGLSGQQHSRPCGFVVLGSYRDLSIAYVPASVWGLGERCNEMVIGKRNTLKGVECLPWMDSRPPPKNSVPESTPGGAPGDFGANPGGKPADRLVLGSGIFDEISEGYDR